MKILIDAALTQHKTFIIHGGDKIRPLSPCCCQPIEFNTNHCPQCKTEMPDISPISWWGCADFIGEEWITKCIRAWTGIEDLKVTVIP